MSTLKDIIDDYSKNNPTTKESAATVFQAIIYYKCNQVLTKDEKKFLKNIRETSIKRFFKVDDIKEIDVSVPKTILGYYYGYPKCCIEEFSTLKPKMKYQIKAGQNSGFIPCRHHAKEIILGDTTLESLISKRVTTKEFSYTKKL